MPRKTHPGRARPVRPGPASMRPRPDAAENVSKAVVGQTMTSDASMRPRPDAAENVRVARGGPLCRPGFNEAAARCRGKPTSTAGSRRWPRCFNEAAARCRGKRRAAPPRDPVPEIASMRPRPDAAENGARTEHNIRIWGHASMRPRPDAAENAEHLVSNATASMRPRPDAAENPPSSSRSSSLLPSASMRPRPDAAENSGGSARCRSGRHASMRPRPDAAENIRANSVRALGGGRFNEAAARCRGKRSCCSATWRRPATRFNEAAARCRGKPSTPLRGCPAPPRFNEAAARCRGKQRDGGDLHGPPLSASMRPRPDAAENERQAPEPRARSPASMRPRPDAAENRAVPCADLRATHCFNEAAARCRGKRSRLRR